MRALIRHRWRQDRLPLLLYLITFFVMTYPFVFHMHDSLPIYNSDTHEALAQNWALREAIIHGKDLNHSELLFHPNGLDISLQPQRWTTFPLWTTLYTVFGDPFAFNLVSMMGILFKAYGMYLFGILLFRARIPAWVTGAFYAFSAPLLMLALRQPNTGATEWIPWFMLFFVYGLSCVRKECGPRTSIFIMVVAGLCFALNMYMNMKIAIFAMLLGGSYVVWSAFTYRLWSRRRFWTAILMFTLTSIAISAPLMIHVLQSDGFGHAIDRPVRADSGGSTDLLTFFKADLERPFDYRQSIASLSGDQLEIGCMCRGISHVGIVGVAFALMGAVYILRFQRKEAIWIVLTVLSALLSLGVVFYVNDKPLDIYWTPYRLLQDNFFFRALWHPFRMIVVLFFPFSVLVGYGLHSRLRTVKLDRRRGVLLTISVFMLLYGTSISPIAMSAAPRPAYLSALEKLPEGAVIDLPMGRHPSKYYMSLQRFHRRPIVEGMLPRTPPDAYDYINSNMLLSMLRNGTTSKEPTEENWRAALEDLRRDGFRYLVLHRQVPVAYLDNRLLPDWISETFIFPPAIHQDDNISVYDITQWDGPFPVSKSGGYTGLPQGDDLNIAAGDNFRLHTWSLLDSVEVQPCQAVTVESWWQSTLWDPTSHLLTLILSEEDGNGQVAISYKRPADKLTSDWTSGVYYRDRVTLEIPCTIASDSYVLLLGMRDGETDEQLQLRSSDGHAIGSLYYLTTVHVATS